MHSTMSMQMIAISPSKKERERVDCNIYFSIVHVFHIFKELGDVLCEFTLNLHSRAQRRGEHACTCMISTLHAVQIASHRLDSKRRRPYSPPVKSHRGTAAR